ncbi:helix-turn-helix domain-containing protein [Eggerthellaceae bacterium zg-893]|nr:helix-turn-helix domain-containing protein [Eggerthellaceae bacterium zg-893]
MTIRENVLKSIEALIEIEGSKAEFARKVGVSRSAVTNWTTGTNAPDIETIAKMAATYSVPLSDILYGNVTGKNAGNRIKAWVDVPVCGSIAAGRPIEMYEYENAFAIPEEMHRRYPNGFLMKVEGESMNRKLANGSYALIDPTSEVVNGKAHAVCVNGYEATIKRVFRLENGYELRPDSTDPTIKSTIYDYGKEGTKTVTVIGRVVWCIYPFDFDI